jgi:hypothetical protein
MAQVQTITITDTSGTTHDTTVALLTQMGTEVDTSTQVAFFETCAAEGTLTQNEELSEDGTTVTITRTWADARWADFAAHTTPGFSAAGWTVVSEDTLHLDGMTTRRDENFGND